MALHLGGQPPRNNFGASVGVFKLNSRNRKTCILPNYIIRLNAFVAAAFAANCAQGRCHDFKSGGTSSASGQWGDKIVVIMSPCTFLL